MKKMGKILPVEAVVGAAMLKNKGWLRGRICFENEVVYTDQRAQCFLSVESFLRHSLLSSYTCCFGKKFEHSLQSYLNLNFLFGLDRRCFSTTFASGKLI